MSERFELPEALKFRPRWWWDPVPDWIVRHLEREELLELAVIQVELHRAMLDLQVKSTDRALKLLQRQPK